MTPEVESACASLGRYQVAEPIHVGLDTPGAGYDLAVPRALYFAYARDRTLHYIGKVDRSRGTTWQRLLEHLRSSRRKRQCWRSLTVVRVAPTLPERELLALERSLISLYQPPGNVQHRSAA